MKRTIFQQFISIFGLTALTVLFLSCPDVPQFQEQQKVKVSFTVTDSATRTVLPQASLMDIASYKLLGGKNGATETVLVESFTGTGTSVMLESGTWNFTLNAYNDSGENILQGKVQNKQINLTGVNQVSFSLSGINSGTGSIQITLNFPEVAGITHISTSGHAGSENFTTDTGSNFVYAKNEIVAGDYLINFELYRGDVLRAVISELVLVRNGLTSSKTITLVEEDLKPIYLTGTVTINPAVRATINTELTASYSGTETVTYQWNKDGIAITGATEAQYTPSSTGSYTVTISVAGFNTSLTSTVVAVIGLPITVSATTLAEKLDWLQINAQSYTKYILSVNADEQLGPCTLSYNGKTNVVIDLTGVSVTRNISLSANGSLFTIGSGVILILDNNITLRGCSNNNSLVRINSGGALEIKSGAKITGNTYSSSYNSSSSSYGGGVYVDSNGTFTMSGGEISGNTAYSSSYNSYSYSYGGGVFNNGTFTMSGGEISGNIASSDSDYFSYSYGGGVYVNNGTFTMSGGEISGNTASSYSSSYNSSSNGGGVYNNGTFTMSGGEISGNTASSDSYYSSYSYGGGVFNDGTFTMSSGTISGNTASSSSVSSSYSNGGGVYVNNGTFTMSGGTISGNTASSSGGGVYVNNGTFTMSGGTISGNTASSSSVSSSYSDGGGVYVNNGTFTMSGGEISGNTAYSSSSNSSSYSYGGGVYVVSYGTFTKSGGGTITGYTSDTVNGNVVKIGNTVQSNMGHAVYVNSSKRRESTAGPGVNMNSSVDGTAGGWEN